MFGSRQTDLSVSSWLLVLLLLTEAMPRPNVRGQGRGEAKALRPIPRPRPKFWPRGHFGFEDLTSLLRSVSIYSVSFCLYDWHCVTVQMMRQRSTGDVRDTSSSRSSSRMSGSVRSTSSHASYASSTYSATTGPGSVHRSLLSALRLYKRTTVFKLL